MHRKVRNFSYFYKSPLYLYNYIQLYRKYPLNRTLWMKSHSVRKLTVSNILCRFIDGIFGMGSHMTWKDRIGRRYYYRKHRIGRHVHRNTMSLRSDFSFAGGKHKAMSHSFLCVYNIVLIMFLAYKDPKTCRFMHNRFSLGKVAFFAVI